MAILLLTYSTSGKTHTGLQEDIWQGCSLQHYICRKELENNLMLIRQCKGDPELQLL
jgi:hypothetical protein